MCNCFKSYLYVSAIYVCMQTIMLMSICICCIIKYMQFVILIDRYPRKKLLKITFRSLYIGCKGKDKRFFYESDVDHLFIVCNTSVFSLSLRMYIIWVIQAWRVKTKYVFFRCGSGAFFKRGVVSGYKGSPAYLYTWGSLESCGKKITNGSWIGPTNYNRLPFVPFSRFPQK